MGQDDSYVGKYISASYQYIIYYILLSVLNIFCIISCNNYRIYKCLLKPATPTCYKLILEIYAPLSNQEQNRINCISGAAYFGLDLIDK